MVLRSSIGVIRAGAPLSRMALVGLVSLVLVVLAPVTASAVNPTITTITVSCDTTGKACGVLTVNNPVGGETVTLVLTAHQTGSAVFTSTGVTTTITLVDGQTEYPFCITVPTQYLDTSVYNTLRIEVQSASAGIQGTDTKTLSFTCTEPPTVVPESRLPILLPLSAIFVAAALGIVLNRRRSLVWRSPDSGHTGRGPDAQGRSR
jgi:hypothetical protein